MEIFAGVSADVDDNSRIGLVGVNGSGKTSLLRVLVGELEPDNGSVSVPAPVSAWHTCRNSPSMTQPGTLRDEVESAFADLFEMERQIADTSLEIQQRTGAARRDAENRYAELLERYESEGRLRLSKPR